MTIRRSERLMNKEKLVKEGTEARDREAAELKAHAENQESSVPHPIEDKEEDITVFQSRPRGEDPMRNHQENDDFIEDVKRLYSTDPLFSKVLTHIEKHPAFYMKDGLIHSKN